MQAALSLMLTCLMLFSTMLIASQMRGYPIDTGRAAQSGGHPDVVIGLPPEAWHQAQSIDPPPCLRCCTFHSRQYSEGAVVKSEGVLLQCARDEHSVGTNNLIWKMLK